jgi:hypothetical protein
VRLFLTRAFDPEIVLPLNRPSPRGDLSGSLTIRSASLRTLVPPPRSTSIR